MPLVDGAPIFQPGFHQALRWSDWTNGTITFRFKVPVARAGSRIRVAFKAGDGHAQVLQATVAKAGENGRIIGKAQLLRFGGLPSVQIEARQRAVSDAVSFPVSAMDELYVTFEGDGAFARSAINAFPDSWMTWGNHAFDTVLPDAVPNAKLTGVNTIEVEAPRERVIVAIGDSISEGYVSGHDDARNAWPLLSAASGGHPVVNASVSGQGLYDANLYEAEDIGVLKNVSDCVVLLGTNDLDGGDAGHVEDGLAVLFDRLRATCRVWAGTLLPKEATTSGEIGPVNVERNAVNAWLRTTASVDGVLEFEAAVQDPDNPDRFKAGLTEDGIHPSLQGQKVLGEFAAGFVSGGK